MDNQQQNQQNPLPPNPQAGQAKGFLQQLEEFFDTYLHKKVPFHLPPNVKEWIVKFGPWIAMIAMLLTLPVILMVLGLGGYGTRLGVYPGGIFYGLSGLITLIVFIMEAAALPGLFKRSLKSWHLIYFAVLVSALGQLLSWNIIGLIVNVAIAMYFLFQIKEYYK